MSSADPTLWRRTSPFAIVFFVGTIVKLLARSLWQAALPMIGMFIVLRDKPAATRIFLMIAAGTLVLILPVAVLKWVCFRYRIEDDRLLVREGILKKTALDIPFERVQGINVERSLVDRVLGLVTVSLDTAGSVQAEGKLPSVKMELAEELSDRVAAVAPTATAEAASPGAPAATGDLTSPGASAASEDHASPGTRTVSRGRILLKLGGGDMVRIGMASRNFILVGAVAGVLADLLQPGDFIEPVLEVIADGVDNTADALGRLGVLARMIAVAAMVFGVVAAAIALTTAAAFLRHHGYTLWHDGASFRSRAGLLTQREVVVEGNKVQQLALSQSLVLRWFGRFRLRALPAAALVSVGGQAPPPEFNAAQVLDIPLLDAPLAEDMRRRVFASESREVPLIPGDRRFRRVSTYYIRALTLRISIVWGLMIGWMLIVGTFFLDLAGTGNPVGTVALGAVLWLAVIPVAALIAWQRWRRQGYVHDDDGLASRSGFIGSKVDAFLMRKVQSVIVRQSPLQRRKRLATLQVHLACGKVAIPYIDHRAACRLRDYILYMVESSRRRWH